ncbi:hypothetical protein [Variovorax boronicumulans]|uniref:hypothetical protein n=1 Tax=Variovorax boronicumulans TaxID=436515 RepID=UPI0012E559C6|nr:hypothetical protein [Variovorax boronicumulans]GER16673.1 hypothetical protein VCH24_16790 [Variovorax boronicumulans]
MSVEVVVVSAVEQIVVEAPPEFSFVEGTNRFEIIELAKQGPKGARGEPGVGGGVQSLVPGANVTIDDTDPAHPIISASGGGGGGEGASSPNVKSATFNLIGTTPVEILRLPVPEGTDWTLEAVTGAGYINGIPATFYGGRGTMANIGGTFTSDFGWQLGGTFSENFPPRFSNLADDGTTPVVDGCVLHAEQDGTDLVFSVRPDSPDATGPCTIVFQGTRNDGVSFEPEPEPATQPAHITSKTITTTSASETFELLRLPMPPGTSWLMYGSCGDAFFNGMGYSIHFNEFRADNRGGTIYTSPFNDAIWVPVDQSVDLVMEGAPVTAAMDGEDIVFSWTVPPNYPGSATFVFQGMRSDGAGFTEVPTNPTAQLSTLAVARLGAYVSAPYDPNPGFFVIPLDTIEENPGGHLNATTAKYTVPATGKYLVSASANFFSFSDAFFEVRRNDTTLRSCTGLIESKPMTFIASLTAGDLVDVGVRYSSTSEFGDSKVAGDADYGKGATQLTIVRLTDANGSGGEVPPLDPEMAKAVTQLKLGAPAWFSAPDFSASGFDVYPDGMTANLDCWMRAPWSSCAIYWGDGEQSELTMNADKNPSVGPQSQLVFWANSAAHAYAVPGTYNVSLIMINEYGYQLHGQDVTVA